MTDIKDLRERYITRPDACPNCAVAYDAPDVLSCWRCGTCHIPDPAVLALCDEVEALRAQVAVERQRSREACQVLVEEVGADGPCSVGDAAARAVAVINALRAQVAAAPEVLREWPKTVEEAPGEWFFCIHGDCAPRGTFTTRDGSAMPVFEDESGGSLWVSGEMKPGEFFVRVPEVKS